MFPFSFARRSISLLEPLGQAFLSSSCPASLGRFPQMAHRLDQKSFELVRKFPVTLRVGCDFKDGSEALNQLRVLAQLLDQLRFVSA
jgi:hypothetical protein